MAEDNVALKLGLINVVEPKLDIGRIFVTKFLLYRCQLPSKNSKFPFNLFYTLIALHLG